MIALKERALVLSVVALMCMVAPAIRSAVAEEKGLQLDYGRLVEANAGLLSGRVIYPDGITPAAKVPVRVWSVKAKKFVREVTTDEKGRYSLRELAVGRYFIVFGDRVRVDVRVAKDARRGVKTLDVVIPHGQVIFAQMAQERRAAVLTLLGAGEGSEGAKGAAKGGGLLKTVIIGAGGAATAVGIVAVVHNIRDSHHEKEVVSP